MRAITWAVCAGCVMVGMSGEVVKAADPTTRPAVSAKKPAAEVDARKALAAKMRGFRADNVSLEHILKQLQKDSGATIFVNWKSLDASGVAKEMPITMDLVAAVPLKKILEMVLDQASAKSPLVYSIDSNIIIVTTQEDADKQMVTKVYYVADLTIVPPPSIAVGAGSGGVNGVGGANGLNGGGGVGGMNNGIGGGTGVGGVSGIGGGLGGSAGGGIGGVGGVGGINGGNSAGGLNGGLNGNSSNVSMAQLQDQKGSDLVSMIESVVRPEIWKDNQKGGNATIKFMDGRLIVTAPRSVQEQIGPAGEAWGLKAAN